MQQKIKLPFPCPKLTIKTLEEGANGVVLVNFIVNFKHVIAGWDIRPCQTSMMEVFAKINNGF